VEGSKTFSKDFMQRHNIPTARYSNFTDYESANAYLDSCDYRVVIKASGLAAGKGVILPTSKEEGIAALKDIMLLRKFGAAGDNIVIEEYLEGEEISLLTLSDGTTHKTLSPGQDHKRAFDGDQGPNTGGMGVYAPTPSATSELMQQIDEQVLTPTFAGLKSEGRTFKGLLFTGLMLTADGPRVLEYNARFGDPETQSVLRLLTDDTDLAAALLACTNGTLNQVDIKIQPRFACNVVVTAGGYPGSYAQGDDIEIGALPNGTS
jgi:phosphoribosylamine--glycine ligase / phosphoribosylformylglycinamidine cyclo-ligase